MDISEEKMDIQVARRNFIEKLAQVILKMQDLDKFLNALTEMAVEIFALSWATLAFLDEDSGEFILKAYAQKMPDHTRILSRQELEQLGAQAHPELRAELEGSDTSVSVPLLVDEQLIGVLNLGTKENNEVFTSEELELFSQLRGLLAPILHQAIQFQKMQEQRLHHQNILDNLVSGIIVIDPQEKITVFNRTAERILQVKTEEVLGKDVRSLQANLANLLLDTLDKSQSYRREELYVMPEKALIGVSTSQFYDARGNLLGACMVFSSLAQIKKKAEMERQQNLDACWSNLATSLAHEVKNSIVATKVYAEMFPQKYEDAEYRWNLYSILKRDMDKLDSFTEKVLNFAQPQEVSLQSCEIDKVMDVAINAALQDKDVDQISLEKRYGEDLKPLRGDYHQLKEAFVQVINNALEAMEKKGRLTISIEQESGPEMLMYNLPAAIDELPQGNLMVIKIQDTGCGILPEHLPRLFDPFFTTKEARSGLGLASARKIIERHRGVIKAEGNPNAGSTFWICLPIE